MSTKKLVTILLGTVVLQGCATLNESECLVSDWYTIGYEDGARGASADLIGKHRKACAKHGVAPDLNAYRQGRYEGLMQYCQPSKGFDLGARGGHYGGVCPGDLEYEFVDAYNAGYKLYELESSVALADRQIYAKKQYLEELKHDMAANAAALISDETSSEDRVLLLAETHDLAKKQGEVEAEIDELQRDRAVREERLARYKASLTYHY